MFNWAVLAGDGNGSALLDRNPLKGFPVPVNLNPVRPVLTDERYRLMLPIAQAVGPEFALALVLARETGHRIGAISALRRSAVGSRRSLKVCYQHPELDRMRQALELLRTENTNGEQAAHLEM